jgi:hypothetical protein
MHASCLQSVVRPAWVKAGSDLPNDYPKKHQVNTPREVEQISHRASGFNGDQRESTDDN